jgi:hypothetical protein
MVIDAPDAMPAIAGPRAGAGGLLVISFGDPAAADYAAFAGVGSGRDDIVLLARGRLGTVDGQFASLVIFLKPNLEARDRQALHEIIARAAECRPAFVCIVSTGQSHNEDQASHDVDYVLRSLRNRAGRVVTFRPGHILSPGSRAFALLRRFGPCYPLLPRRVRGCCVEGDELFKAIERERKEALGAPEGELKGRRLRRPRDYVLLGANRRWRDWLAEHRAHGPLQLGVTIACTVLALLGIGQLAALVFGIVARQRPALRQWNVHTLRPGTFRQLLALYNKYNRHHVKVVGYNNGVNHFGQRYPGRTVVSTVRLDRVVRAGSECIRADCGATIRKARDFLTAAGQDLYVIPNYSYVCLGTAFFVPIHGSAAAYSCVADTITKVVLYDPVLDRLISTSREERDFRNRAYDLNADVLLLRLSLRVKPTSSYYVHHQELKDPGADVLLDALRDPKAANAEVRKSNAAGSSVQVSKYYNDAGDSHSPVLELPRDSLGRLWDRLEENPITSFLMHALTRHLAFHVELFFTAEEFAIFWKDHGGLPLRKIQLRYIKKDGLPQSPFREHDCVSADTFMLRKHRVVFEEYLKRTFTVVRANPGKHSV